MPSFSQSHQTWDLVESLTGVKHPSERFQVLLLRDLFDTSCRRSLQVEGDGT